MSKLFIGFAAGLLVGVLFAPERGTLTRDRIARRGRELKEKFNDMVDSLHSKADDLADEAHDVVERGKQKARSFAADSGVAGTGNTWAG
jgi:gas vesicle protein